MVLESIGLDEEDERVYFEMLAGTRAAGLPAHTALSAERVRLALDRLERLRLVRARKQGDPEVVPPEYALPTLINARVDAIRVAQRAAERLATDLSLVPVLHDPSRLADAVPADEAARQVKDMLQHASTDVLVAEAQPGVLPVTMNGSGCLAELGARGVRLRIVSSDQDDPVARLGDWAAGNLRVTPSVPASFILVDDRHAALTLTQDPGEPGTVAIVYGSALLSLLSSAGDALWRQGRPPGGVTVSDGLLSQENMDLLRMLARGMKDEAIARRLDIGIRTASRRVTDLLELLGARSRFQAGVKAHRQGLL